jgi:hypothetical protein
MRKIPPPAAPVPENFSRCEKIFVPWSWAAAIITGFIVIVTAAGVGYSARETKQDDEIKKISIQNDLDTIKTLLRKGCN